ncbi:hypothetical protein Nizo1840_0066 [Lactiplantibacillus plantarum]|nr:hypothetical protein SF2A35B_0965 [Lactiplantibacillus plantarum]KZT77842.1 hypothetical protein Nizo1839_2647 [Lactiplantibacillus plantarum]KZT91057.1 hypothetical protein Nizo1840_0066 [Lactiplantibacillus plantarum]KZU16347.1 hypothetical protein Nizo2264_0477 [Lactiplantibacillus plantarum]
MRYDFIHWWSQLNSADSYQRHDYFLMVALPTADYVVEPVTDSS